MAWIETIIGAVCEVLAGQSPRGSNYNYLGVGLPFYQGKKEFGDKYIGSPTTWTTQITREAYAGDILMSVRAPVGPINYTADHICIGRGLAAIRAGNLVDPDFLFYWLLFIQEHIKGNEGAVFSSINKRQIQDLPFKYPPLPEQERIVSILDESFAAIDTAIANTEKNLVNTQELFSSYLSLVFNASSKDWVFKTVDELAKHSLGKMLDKKKNRGDLYPYLRNLNVRWFSFDLTDMREMRFETTELEKYTACQGDLLICEGGYPGRAAIWDDPQPIYFQKAIHRVRFLEPSHTKWFLYFLYFLDLTGEIRQYFTGAGIQHFTGRILGKVRIPLLSLDEINYYVVIFEASKSNIDYLSTLNKKKLGLLTKLKQSILHQAFTGQLTNTPTEALKAAGL